MPRTDPDEIDELTQLDAIEAALLENNARLARIEALLTGRAIVDERHVRLLTELAGSMGQWDHLPFTAGEVIEHARVCFGLEQALQACGVRSVAACGALFRTLRDREVGSWRLIREGRSWRLVCT